MRNKGLIQIYTGDGKGKTTAAIGLACRALGHNLKICYICFHKEPGKWDFGEHRILRELGVEVKGFAQQHPHFDKSINKAELREKCVTALKFIREIFQENKYDLLILDELLISLRDGFLKEEEVLDMMNAKPAKLELVLTGRGATPKIIEGADLVSEIKEIKHPYHRGITNRKGIEY
jgi:cob(I)alamin adenosyltransferase